MTISWIRLDCVLKNPFGKTATKLMDFLLNRIKRIATLTGTTELSALFILSKIGAGMSVFELDNHLASWAELTPANNESANKKKSIRCSKAGQYLKPLLVQCALAAIISKKEPYFAIKYQRLAKRRGKKKAIIAIARMMLIIIYHMLSNNVDFHPSTTKP